MNTETAERRALREIAAILGDGMTASHVGGHFTCGEAETIADAIRLVDAHAAEVWLDGHAEGDDDEGDDPEHVARRELAEARVRALQESQRCSVDGCTQRPTRTRWVGTEHRLFCFTHDPERPQV